VILQEAINVSGKQLDIDKASNAVSHC
jgi:hypothetical protein